MASTETIADDPLWYKDAVIYELHVRAFGDSNGDGIGDFAGLTARLDYLQQLGVTALWLLPFYPSPLRDDGYDIADYGGINAAYGNLRTFKKFLVEAHRRGLRVITELVLNHTSDQHLWFQRSRQAKPQSRWRDYYVWSDSPERYREARVIFEDYETSNWTWDPVGGAYYWHRFFSHQPDLNYDNPEVREVMLRMVDRWLEMGVDGVRLDAIPYLFERDGTGCENLPETHGFLKELRSHVDALFPGRMLLGEANQWPEDAAAYFGETDKGGDECHMNFHFPLMPRLFMALRMEDRYPVIDILQQTPDIPSACQWAIFLRNHDELTLEMVTDEERDYMYRAYAADPQMRVNVGIRRRLAPLLQNDRRKIELMNGLLLSLPGTPVVYYGDELGMGDNVFLGDRDSVRTPMQWSPDRSAGFSDANPDQLYLPVIVDHDYHYESVNVEAQDRNPSSLLWWMRRIIALRQQHTVFGRGEIEFLFPENAKVFAFLRSDENETVLVIANLSRFAQVAALDLHDHRGSMPVELFGGNEFPVIGEGAYNITLGPYGFYWFSLDPQRQEARFALNDASNLATITVADDWDTLFTKSRRAALEGCLPAFLERNRWYAGRQRVLRSATIDDAVPIAFARGKPAAYLCLLVAEYADGEPDTYIAALMVSPEMRAETLMADHPNAAAAWIVVRGTNERMLLHDAMVDAAFAENILAAFQRKKVFASPTGAELRLSSSRHFRDAVSGADDLTVHVPSVEQSNSSVIFGNRIVLKMFRRAQEGVNPDLELGEYLTTAGFEHAAPLLGAIEYYRAKGEPRTIAVVNGYVAHEGDAWHYTLDALGLYYEVATSVIADDAITAPAWSEVVQRATTSGAARPPDVIADAIGPYLDSAELLGRRTAELHRALADAAGDDFEPEPFTALWQRSLFQSMRAQVRPTLQQLRRALNSADAIDIFSDQGRADGEAVLGLEHVIYDEFAAIKAHRFDASRIRVHGDFHLGQVLHSGRDFVIIDFEGEPSRTPTERRIKRSALADVAGMIRSFQYAARAGLVAYADRGLVPPERWAAFEARERTWQMWVTIGYLAGYLAAAEGAPFVPAEPDDLHALLTAHLLDKALYEVRYDLGHRPDWAPIPLRGIVQLLAGLASHEPEGDR